MARWPRPVVIQGGRDGAGADAGTPDGAAPGRSGRTNGSAGRAAGPGRPGRQRRGWSSSRPAPTDHRPAARVNRDASLSLAAPASGRSGPHASGGHGGSPGSAAQPAGPCGGAHAPHCRRRNRSHRGHSSCKQSPADGNRHTGTDGLISDWTALLRRFGMDERLPWQDTQPACVPGTMWGHGAEPDGQVMPGVVLAPELWQARRAPSSRFSWAYLRSDTRRSITRSLQQRRQLWRHLCAMIPDGTRRHLRADSHRR